MNSGHFPRKLAAVLYADVAGYSRLTEQDEQGTHLRVLRYKRILAEQVLNKNGHVVHSEGDSLLADFFSATNALICALDVQKILARCNRELPAHRQVHFRIGLNFSEVNVDVNRQRIFGYGVNVAARLEALAEPGSVCVSQSIREAIPDTLPVQLHYMGARAVKNITQRLNAFKASPAPSKIPPQVDRQSILLEPEQLPPRTDDHLSFIETQPVTDLLSTSIWPPAFNGASLTQADELLPAPSLTRNLLTQILNKPLSRLYNRITQNPYWREQVAQTLDSTPRTTGIAVHTNFLQRWLRWSQTRFGPFRNSLWKQLDFCLLHSFVYSSLFFFIGLIFLQGDASIGELQISYLEIGTETISDPNTDVQLMPEEAGTLPILLVLFAIYAIVDRLWRRTRTTSGRQATTQHFDALRSALWLTVSTILTLLLALNGFGAGFATLTVAVGAIFLRGMRGSGLLFVGTSAIVILALNIIVEGAEAGQPTMQSIALNLHGLSRVDVDRFLLMWLLFPVINGLFDTISWHLSRRMGLALRFGRRSLRGVWLLHSPRAGNSADEATITRYWLATLYWGLLDIAIALLLLAGAATIVGASLELLDYIRHDHTGFYTQDNLIEAITTDPLGRGFWLIAMLATTLIPTLLHLTAVALGLFSTLGQPIKQGERLSSVLMYGPAHPLFDLASQRAAWLQLTRIVRAVTLAGVWLALLGWIVANLLKNDSVLQLLANSLKVGQQFATLVIRLMP